MRHVCNKHTDHPDEDYKNCNHGGLQPRKWIKIGKLFLIIVLLLVISKQDKFLVSSSPYIVKGHKRCGFKNGTPLL